MSAELCLRTAACASIFINTPRQRADRAAGRALHVAFNHDKGSFYTRLLEEVTDLANCQEKRVPTRCPEDANAPRGTASSQGTAHTPRPRAVPRGARFPTITRHSFNRQTVKRPRSQQLSAIETALLPILLRGECCRVVEAPSDWCLGLNPWTSPQGRSSSFGWACGSSG